MLMRKEYKGGGGASSENILRREFDVLEGDYK